MGNTSEFATLTHKALGSIKKEQIRSCLVALPCHLSFLYITCPVDTGSSEHLCRRGGLGIRMIPVVCTRKRSNALNYIEHLEQSCLLCLEATRAEKCKTP